MKITRRSLLAGAACTAPFLPLLSSHAGAPAAPKRLVLVFTANGTITNAWRPTGTENDFTLSPMLSSLEPYQDKLLVVDGVRINGKGIGGSHARGIAQLWTGAEILEGDLFESGNGDITGWGGGTSVDQVIAADATTPYKSLEFGVASGAAELNSRMIYAGPNQPIAPENSPLAMFDRLFGDFSTEPGELARIRAEKQSVIDVVKSQVERARDQIGKDDRDKLDAHLEGVFELERRLATDVPVTEACDPPSELGYEPPYEYGDTGSAQMDMLVMALKCDLTRVASLQWSKAVSHKLFDFLGHVEDHHDLSHKGNSDEEAQAQLIEINTWYAERFAQLLGALDATPEGDATMLDNTMVVWGNELGVGNTHSLNRVPFIVAGGAGGYLRPGRFVQQVPTIDHNRLLVSICHAMGREDIETYGNTDEGTGPYPGLT